jgi:hypothetical protein
MTPGFADRQQKTVSPNIIGHLESQGTEPVLILQRPAHYEAVAPTINIADQPLEHVTLSDAEIATMKAQEEVDIKIMNNVKPDDIDLTKLNACLDSERKEVIRKIKAIQIETPEPDGIPNETYNSFEGDNFKHLDDIFGLASIYPKEILKEKIRVASYIFNSRLDQYLNQYNVNSKNTITVNPIHPDLYPPNTVKTKYRGVFF